MAEGREISSSSSSSSEAVASCSGLVSGSQIPPESTPTGGSPPSASFSSDSRKPSGSTPTPTRGLPPSTASPRDAETSPKPSSTTTRRLSLPISMASSQDLKKSSGSNSTRTPSSPADLFSDGADVYNAQESSRTGASRNGRRSSSISEDEKIPLLSIDAVDLHRRSMNFLESSADTALAVPAAGLAKALWVFASAESKAKSGGQLKAAASVLARSSASEKLPEEVADTAKRLAFDATRLVFQEQAGTDRSGPLARIFSCCCPSAPHIRRCWSWCCDDKLPLHLRDVDRQKLLLDKRSALYCLSMPASLALLPYLPAIIPKDRHILMAYMYGIVFSSASVGLVLSLHALNRFELEIARVLSRLSFVGLSMLVVFYLYYALSPGNLGVLGICSLILALGHGYAWIRSCCTRVDDPSLMSEVAQSAQDSE